jgi:hypothetical protein
MVQEKDRKFNLKMLRKDRPWHILRYYSDTCMEGLSENTKDLSQDRRSSDRDLNPGPPEYEAVLLNTWSDVRRKRFRSCPVEGLVQVALNPRGKKKSDSLHAMEAHGGRGGIANTHT